MAGTTDPLTTPRSGQYRFTIETDEPAPLPPTPTCPNEQWTTKAQANSYHDISRSVRRGKGWTDKR
jgi:hypothetical protein